MSIAPNILGVTVSGSSARASWESGQASGGGPSFFQVAGAGTPSWDGAYLEDGENRWKHASQNHWLHFIPSFAMMNNNPYWALTISDSVPTTAPTPAGVGAGVWGYYKQDGNNPPASSGWSNFGAGIPGGLINQPSPTVTQETAGGGPPPSFRYGVSRSQEPDPHTVWTVTEELEAAMEDLLPGNWYFLAQEWIEAQNAWSTTGRMAFFIGFEDLRLMAEDGYGQRFLVGPPGVVGQDGRLVTQNPNILINTDFRHPIDQRGIRGSAMTGGGEPYTIDRWRLACGDISQAGGAVRVSYRTAGNMDFIQRVENPGAFFGKTVTLSTAMRGSKDMNVILYFGSTPWPTTWIPGDGEWQRTSLTATVPVDATIFGIYLRISGSSLAVGDWFEVAWAKLEEGEVATPWQVPDPQRELARCQRYCRVWRDSFVAAGLAGSASEGNFALAHGGMRATPVLTWEGDFKVYSPAGQIAVTALAKSGDANASLLSATTSGLTHGHGCLLRGFAGSKLILDAEI